MKKYLVSIAQALCFLFVLSSCENEDDKLLDGNDIPPYSLYVDVVDPEGNSLITSETVAGVPLANISATYNGQTEILRNIPGTFAESEFYCTEKDGRRIVRNLLIFGSFDAYEKCENQMVVLDWGDGTKDTITFSNYPQMNKAGQVSGIKQSILLNGTPVNNPFFYPMEYIRIVKQNQKY